MTDPTTDTSATEEKTTDASPVPDTASVTETSAAPEPLDATSPLVQARLRVEALGGSLRSIIEEKEAKRQDIEARFQQVQKQLKAEWDETQKSYDMRINALQQELLKSQGVVEYLHNLEQAAKGDN